MKNYIIISLLFLSLGFSQNEYYYNDIQEFQGYLDGLDNIRGGEVMFGGEVIIRLFGQPITGLVFKNYYYCDDDSPTKVLMGNLINGKKDGRWKGTFLGDRREIIENYKDGIKHGVVIYYRENGKKSYRTYFNNGKHNGLDTMWFKSGIKSSELTWINNSKEGKEISWFSNGQKKLEQNWKNNKLNGEKTIWFFNGQKSYEGIFKDGKEISIKEWDEDGSVKN
jgi:antitoxin component YwqK of YwqJK toxin-antitoxin module